MKKGIIAVFIMLFCSSLVFAEARAQLSKSSIVFGESVQVTVFPGVKDVYQQHIVVFMGKRQVGAIGLNDPLSKISKEKFSPGVKSYVVSYTPKQPGSYDIKVYDYDARKYIVLPLTVANVNYASKKICSKVKTFAVRGRECSKEICALKGMEFAGCLKDSTYSRAVCKQIVKTECGGACTADFSLESIEKCS
jgi:hypothetical protein